MKSSVFDGERLIRLGRVVAVVPSPGGDWAAVAVQRLDADGAKYVSDLWRVPLDGQGEASQLTRGAWRDSAPCFRRDGALGFLSNRPVGEKPEDGEDERSQVWLLPAEGGEPRPLTDEPLGVDAFRFAAEGDRLACVAPVLPGVAHEEQREAFAKRKKQGPSALRYRDMPVRFWDHWLPETAPHVVVFDERGEGREDLTPEATIEHRDAELEVSRDGRRLAVTSFGRGPDRMLDVRLLVIDLEDGGRTLLGEPQEELERPRFSPDGRRLAAGHRVRSAELAGRTTLRVYELESGEVRRPTQAWDRWSVLEGWTPDGRTLLATADDGGRTPLFGVDVETGRVVRLTAEAKGGAHEQVAALAAGDRVVGVRSTFFHPPEPFVMALQEGAEPRLLANLSGFTEGEGREVAAVSEVAVTSSDGEPVQTFLVEPAGGDGPRPTVLWIHGGPMGAWHDGWHWRWNPLVLAARGYAVGLPNPRGSTGFGQEFVEGIWGNVWGAQCYEDVLAATDALAACEGVAADRIAAMGGSFGGYMTNWIGANTDRFACLVTHASVFSMSLFYGDTDMPPFWALFMGGYPYGDPDVFDRYSPSRHLDKWRSPTLIIHGERDYRVPISQALHLFEGLHYHGVDVELLVFPDENHWILKPRNIVTWYESVLEYLGRHL